jgi:hypothetical protein
MPAVCLKSDATTLCLFGLERRPRTRNNWLEWPVPVSKKSVDNTEFCCRGVSPCVTVLKLFVSHTNPFTRLSADYQERQWRNCQSSCTISISKSYDYDVDNLISAYGFADLNRCASLLMIETDPGMAPVRQQLRVICIVLSPWSTSWSSWIVLTGHAANLGFTSQDCEHDPRDLYSKQNSEVPDHKVWSVWKVIYWV